jgi:hypothetical protein
MLFMAVGRVAILYEIVATATSNERMRAGTQPNKKPKKRP